MFSTGRKYVVSKEGILGLGPVATSPSGLIAIMDGLEFPFLLRPDRERLYRIVGQAYVHGVMDGEFMEGANLSPKVAENEGGKMVRSRHGRRDI